MTHRYPLSPTPAAVTLAAALTSLAALLGGCLIGDAGEPTADEIDAEGLAGDELVAAQAFCPAGFAFDTANQLCLSATEAVGPFPRSMIDDCKRFVADRADGTNSCETTPGGAVTTRWARSLAIGARTRTLQPSGCAAGTARHASGYCADATNLYGPFSKEDVAYCKSNSGGNACETNRVAPGLVKPRPQTAGEWSYILAVDHGVRDDAYGAGHFGAARSNSAGTHSGVDFLAPVGTAVLSACDSADVQVGYDGGYGNWVQIACPAPPSLSGGRTLWASLLYSHLDSVAVSTGGTVRKGQRIGSVGKSGNAGAAGINAHLHWEVTLHATQAAAHADAHGSADNTSTTAAVEFEASLRAACLTPGGVQALTGPVRRGRRPDPYLMLVCSVRGKPALAAPPASLQSFLVRWRQHYSATGFDIDAGK